jgi:4-amino-4-deoxy-L-arabinose transferase-like glycosyltransferase
MRTHFTPSQLDADEFEYYKIAGRISSGTYELEPTRVLGHPVVLSFLRSVTGDRLILVQLAVTLLCSLTAPIAYCWVRRELLHQGAALTAAIGITFWPLFIRYSATLYSETLALPCFTAMLLLLPSSRACKTDRWKRGFRWIALGVVFGLCMHLRPMYLLFAPFLTLLIVLSSRGIVRAIAPLSLVFVGALLAVAPWSIALSRHERTFVLLSSNGGQTLGGGLNPALLQAGQGSYKSPSGRVVWDGPGKWRPPHATGYLTPEELDKPTSIRDRIEKERAIAWMRSHPGAVAYLSLRKLSYMWGIYPVWNGLAQTLMGNVPTLLLLFLSGVALARFRRVIRPLLPFVLLPIFVSCVALVSWGSWRFRQPGDLGLLVLVAALPWAATIARQMRGSDGAKREGNRPL